MHTRVHSNIVNTRFIYTEEKQQQTIKQKRCAANLAYLPNLHGFILHDICCMFSTLSYLLRVPPPQEALQSDHLLSA